MARKSVNTTLDENLYKRIQILALMMNKKANDLIEEGMIHIIEKYDNQSINKTSDNK